jgi:hypothetical protein
MNFARGGRLAQDRSPPHPLLTPRCPPRRTLRVLQHLDAVNAQVSALGRHRASPLANAPMGGGRAVSGPCFPLGQRGATVAHAASIDAVARESHLSRRIPAAGNPTTTNDESYHGSTSKLPPATSHGYAD